MANIVLAIALFAGAAAQDDSACLGFIDRSLLPMNVFVAGTESDGFSSLAEQAELVYLNGPGLESLRAGGIYLVIRAEGYVKHPETRKPLGIYYRELGTVRIETKAPQSASATVLTSCQLIMKGDLVVPLEQRPAVQITGKASDRLTQVPQGGISSLVVLGLDDRRELGAGHFCFIGAGSRDGVRAGDWFTVFRAQQRFNPQDLSVAGSGKGRTYSKVLSGLHKLEVTSTLKGRDLPPMVVGDLVVLRVSESTAIAKVVSSRSEVHVGDAVVRR